MPIGVYSRTEYHKEIMRKSHIGLKQSAKTISRRLATFRTIGYIPKPPIGSHTGFKHSDDSKRKISKSRSRGGRPYCIDCGKYPISYEAKRCKKCSNVFKKQVGEKSSNWKGGITPINVKIRHSLEYKLWRQQVFNRDKWTCILCGFRSKGNGDIHADHIKPFSLFPELKFDLDNGRTLCVICHKNTNSFMNPKITRSFGLGEIKFDKEW